MFRSITEEPPPRIGKIFSEGSFHGKSTTYAPGREDWNTDYKTHMTKSFVVSKFINQYLFDHFNQYLE